MDRVGRYQIVRELGRGAMGVVYHAIDPNIGRPVAIKIIRLAELVNPQERARLQDRLFREARSAGILSHPGIVTIYDVDLHRDVAFIAMEFVNGPTLDQVLSVPSPLEPERILKILTQTAAALDYAHAKGIVHRDIKPPNIMLNESGAVKITDFGIAKITTSEQHTLTGAIVGTPHYISPEQVQGVAVDGCADQFSLAVIAFEMLTGERPFSGEHLTTVVYKIVAEEPHSLRRLNPTLDPAVEPVLLKALSKKPENRYTNCHEFIEALRAGCAATQGWKAVPRGATLDMETVGMKAPPGIPDLPVRRRILDTTTNRERRRLSALPLLMAIVVAAGFITMIAWQTTPWSSNSTQKQEAAKPVEPPPPTPEKAQSPEEAVSQSTPSPTAGESEPASTEPPPEAKAKPEEDAPAPQPAAEEPVRERSALSSSVSVATDPAGATAMLDGRPQTECKTPCSLEASAGRHNITITLPGYQTERREIVVHGAEQELSLITMRAIGGTLLVSSAPPGAAVSVNGEPTSRVTPVQLNLAPGTYTITVEKDGQQASERIVVRDGATSHLRIPLGQ